MSAGRVFSTIFIFIVLTVAWMVLGCSIWARTDSLDHSLSAEMNSLWGPQVLNQQAPYLTLQPAGQRTAGDVTCSASNIKAGIAHEYRYKGLLWYSTFRIAFDGKYTTRPVTGSGPNTPEASWFVFPLPKATVYDDLQVQVDQSSAMPVTGRHLAEGRLVLQLDNAKEHQVTVRYATSGRETWLYSPADAPTCGSAGPVGRGTEDEPQVFSSSGAPSELRDFSMEVHTSFRQIDYPRGTRSPSTPAIIDANGATARWEYANA